MSYVFISVLTLLPAIVIVYCDYLENNFGVHPDGANHPCYRECGGLTMICEYNLTIRSTTSMNKIDCGKCPFEVEDCTRIGCITAGGYLRPVIAVNQKIPGPPLLVCENDRIVVNVKNELRTETTSIHWHGIHQDGTFFMDGVPYVTQFPIPPFDTFRYEFTASPHGTQMWHGHSGFQESDGLYGVLIVRRKEPTSIEKLYDYDLPEHTMVIWHWYDKPTGGVLETVLHQNGSIFGNGFLINGKAALKEYKQNDGASFYTSREKFNVEKGVRYRFRVIYNSAIYCPLQLSIDNHKLKIFASDTSPFEPVEVDSFMISAGERYDFVLSADRIERCYWLRIRALGDCGETKNKLHDGALICYNNATNLETSNENLSYDGGRKSGLLLNPSEVLTEDYSKNELIYLTDLNSTEIEEVDYSVTPNVTFYVELWTHPIDVLRYPGPWHQFNNISFLFPDSSFLKNQLRTDGDNFCDDENREEKCKGRFCSYTYVKKIPKAALVEMVLFDATQNRKQDHPVHMHGYQFYVVSQGALGPNITLKDIKLKNEKGFIAKKLKNAPLKDTVSVPNKGYIILRFYSNNIGFWVFHCHVTNHMELGMAFLIQVGEQKDLLSQCKKTNQCDAWFNSASQFNKRHLVLLLSIVIPYIW